MPTLLFIIGLVALFFIVSASVLLRRKDRHWTRIALAVPCIVLGLLALVVLAGLAWEHYTPPPASVFLDQFQKSAALKDRTAILAELKARGFALTLDEKPFPADDTAYSIAPADIARSASYLRLRTTRVRPHDLFAEYLNVVFLFDAQGQLITWSYTIDSPSL